MTQSAPRFPQVGEYRAIKAREKVLTVRKVIPHPPETIVRYIGQVDFLNKIAGNPIPNYRFAPDGHGGTITSASAKKGGMTLNYVELPYEWYYPVLGRAENFQSSGPLSYICVEYELKGMGESTEVSMHGRRASRGTGFLGWIVGQGFMAAMRRALEGLARDIVSPNEDPLALAPFNETEAQTGVNREELRRRFSSVDARADVIRAVADFVATAPDKFMQRLRPLQIAYRYHLPETETIEFFLRATRCGLFNLSWDLLCPTCRGDKAKFATLAELENSAHCDYCNIDYGSDFAKNVELTFRPVPSVRKIIGGSYCINSPGNTAFIHSQVNVWPDKPTTASIQFPETHYQLRSPHFPGIREVEIRPHGPDLVTIDLASELDGNPRSQPLILSASIHLELKSNLPYPVTAKFFRASYRDYALTAARVTSMQEFRDLFGAEALSPGINVGVENLCFLFTDLKDSTPMYEKLGDAPAFALVREHFATLIEEVRKRNGAVVKTIGDAVMAVFTNQTEALEAAIAIQTRIRANHPGVSVKIGLHAGPCIAVNSNDKLDYFGTTVNRAARIQGLADGQEIVMSRDLAHAANVALPPGFQSSEFVSAFNGISGDANLVRWRLQ